MTEPDPEGAMAVGAIARQGRYEDAVSLLSQRLLESRRDSLLFRERAYLHLYFGHPQEARADFDTTARLDAAGRISPGRLHSDLEYNAIGVTYWVEGHEELALAFWRYTTDMHYKGRVDYSEFGGGITAGLLLWFGAVHKKSPDDLTLVRSLYEKRLASKGSPLTGHPLVLVRYFLEMVDEKDVLDNSKRQQEYCKAQFAIAVRARAARRYAAYKQHLQLAVPGKGPSEIYDFYNVLPYFLARHAVGASVEDAESNWTE